MNDLQAQNLFVKHAQFLRKHSFKLLSIGVSLIALISTFMIHNRAEQNLATSKALLQQQQVTNSEADNAANLLRQYLPAYRGLQERRVIASPERLQWLETLQTSVDENLVPKMSFLLSPTASASIENTIYMHETIAVKVTPMRLEFTLLHEGDMLRLLGDMHSQALGLFSADTCELERNEELKVETDTAQSFSRANFKGSCDLRWYSLADITSAWEVPGDSE